MGGFFDNPLGAIGDFLGKGDNLSSILTAGTSLFSNIVRQDAADSQAQAALDAQKESEKFKYLVELAKLKYGSKGGGGGGGGSLRNKNADLIEVLASGNDDRLKALEQFTAGYVNSYK